MQSIGRENIPFFNIQTLHKEILETVLISWMKSGGSIASKTACRHQLERKLKHNLEVNNGWELITQVFFAIHRVLPSWITKPSITCVRTWGFTMALGGPVLGGWGVTGWVPFMVGWGVLSLTAEKERGRLSVPLHKKTLVDKSTVDSVRCRNLQLYIHSALNLVIWQIQENRTYLPRFHWMVCHLLLELEEPPLELAQELALVLE